MPFGAILHASKQQKCKSPAQCRLLTAFTFTLIYILKIQFLVTLATFQGLISHTWPAAVCWTERS